MRQCLYCLAVVLVSACNSHVAESTQATVNKAAGLERVKEDQNAMASVKPSIDATYADAERNRAAAEAAAEK